MDWRTDYKSALAWFTESFMCYNENVTYYKSAPARAKPASADLQPTEGSSA